MRPPLGQTSSPRPRCTQQENKKRLADGLLIKINTHAFETEEQIKSLNNKIPQNEKSINRLEVQLDENLIECERTEATISEKRGSNSEKVLNEWKVKAEDLALVLEAVRSKAAKEDSIDQLNISGMVSVKY